MKLVALAFCIAWLAIGFGILYDQLPNNIYDGHITPKHRPMQEIDLQGHQEHGPRHPCPAVYDAPKDNLRYCL